MDIFEQASARASETAPAPIDRPLTAAATASGFGLVVIAMFVLLETIGLPGWLCWLGAAAAYGGIAYLDCMIGWNRHKRVFQDALADLKDQSSGPSLH